MFAFDQFNGKKTKQKKLKIKIINDIFRENRDQGVKSAVKQWKQNMRLLSCKSDSIKRFTISQYIA